VPAEPDRPWVFENP